MEMETAVERKYPSLFYQKILKAPLPPAGGILIDIDRENNLYTSGSTGDIPFYSHFRRWRLLQGSADSDNFHGQRPEAHGYGRDLFYVYAADAPFPSEHGLFQPECGNGERQFIFPEIVFLLFKSKARPVFSALSGPSLL